MIQLYDYFHRKSKDLYYSLTEAGFEGPVVVINDDGYLPEGVTSPYAYFCGMEHGQGKPLYFNELPVPTYWEITGTNAQGEVWDYSKRMAKVFYAEPKHCRLVKNVDWMDREGKVRFTDHYNQYGWLFARSYFSASESLNTKTYFNQAGQEVILENIVTGTILLNWQGKTHCFENRVGLLDFYFSLQGCSNENIWYNSLSTPFFYSYNKREEGQDILFWQEEIGDDIPGNMKVMLKQDHLRTQRVIVQDKKTYDKMISLVPQEQVSKLSYLGLVYPEKRQVKNTKSILILTNSDQLEQLEELTEVLKDYTFHIGALTEMSQKLMAFEQASNVKLYPNISQKQVDDLYQDCDIYLDINHGSEVQEAVRTAFEHNLLILAFKTTLHNEQLVPEIQRFEPSQAQEILAYLKRYEGQLDKALRLQREQSSHEQVERYQSVLK